MVLEQDFFVFDHTYADRADTLGNKIEAFEFQPDTQKHVEK